MRARTLPLDYWRKARNERFLYVFLERIYPEKLQGNLIFFFFNISDGG